MIKLNTDLLFSLVQDTRDSLTADNIQIIALKAMALAATHPAAELKTASAIAQQIEAAEKNQPAIYAQDEVLLSKHINTPSLVALIQYLSDCQEKGLLTIENKIQWIESLLNKIRHLTRSPNIYLDDSLYELSQQLFSETGEEVYLPFETSFYHSLMLRQKHTVYAEGLKQSIIPVLLNQILGNVHYKNGDAANNPAYMQQGKLQTFKNGFIVEPWKMRDFKVDEQRFAVNSNNYQNYLIQHTIQQVSNMVLAIVPINNLTSSVQSEEKMRQWLLKEKHLKAVITLPTGMVMNTGLSAALLVLDLTQEHDSVKMITLANSENEFVSKTNRETHLINTDKLAQIILRNQESPNARNIPYQEIAANGYTLTPERYVLDDQAQQAINLLQQYNTKPLGKLVSIIRPEPPIKFKSEGEESIFEIHGSDLPEYGYIETASKENKVSQSAYQELQAAFLQANDIIITVRGTIGKVGIVSQEMLDKYQGKVVIGQTSFILRVNQAEAISPKALLMQLRSQLAQARFQLFSTGTVINGMSIKDLKEFEIALFNAQQQQELAQRFAEQERIKQAILLQQQKQYQLANDFWQASQQ